MSSEHDAQAAIQQEIAYYNALPCEFTGHTQVPPLNDGEIFLVCIKKSPAVPEKGWVPAYDFAVCKGGEKLGARLVRKAQLPEWHDLYKEGQRYANIYEWSVE